jgi:hypothetical protein
MKVKFLPSYRWWLAEKVPREQSTLCPSSRCSPSSTLFCFSVGQIITTIIIIQLTIITINFISSFSLCRKFGHLALEKTVFFCWTTTMRMTWSISALFYFSIFVPTVCWHFSVAEQQRRVWYGKNFPYNLFSFFHSTIHCFIQTLLKTLTRQVRFKMATHFMFVSAQKLNEKGSQKCEFKSSFEWSTFESFDRLSCGRQHYCEVKERRNRPAGPNFTQSRERERERER